MTIVDRLEHSSCGGNRRKEQSWRREVPRRPVYRKILERSPSDGRSLARAFVVVWRRQESRTVLERSPSNGRYIHRLERSSSCSGDRRAEQSWREVPRTAGISSARVFVVARRRQEKRTVLEGREVSGGIGVRATWRAAAFGRCGGPAGVLRAPCRMSD